MPANIPEEMRRFLPLCAACVITLAVVGFLLGLREPRSITRQTPPPASPSDTPPALTYAEFADAHHGTKTNRAQTLAALKFDCPGIFDPVTRTEEMKLAALADRARNRAYDGAPPTIPHPVEAQSAASCLACHGEGMKVGDRIASKISHAQMTNCTQCHVEQSPVEVETNFVGVFRAGPGERASPGAPPTIPHQTFLRENCTSCHGLLTRPGTRTTHPWLTNCTQCHAPSAGLDQRDFTGESK